MDESTDPSLERQRRLLQICVGVTAMFPLVLGFTVAVTGLRGFWFLFMQEGEMPHNPTLDSAVRFLAANFFGMGLMIVWVLPKIERRTRVFQIIVGTVVFGGIVRVLSHVTVGRPNLLTELLIGVEFAVLLLGFWQYHVAKRYRALASRTS